MPSECLPPQASYSKFGLWQSICKRRIIGRVSSVGAIAQVQPSCISALSVPGKNGCFGHDQTESNSYPKSWTQVWTSPWSVNHHLTLAICGRMARHLQTNGESSRLVLKIRSPNIPVHDFTRQNCHSLLMSYAWIWVCARIGYPQIRIIISPYGGTPK